MSRLTMNTNSATILPRTKPFKTTETDPSLKRASPAFEPHPHTHLITEMRTLFEDCYYHAENIVSFFPRDTKLPHAKKILFDSAVQVAQRAAIEESLGETASVEEYKLAVSLLQYLLQDCPSDDEVVITSIISRLEGRIKK
jgi:hypothetical protein